jgi:hypothetical protein
MMNHEENKCRVTLEDLIQLKRAERPSPEFWVRFERELRAKQLAAIVAKRPWWRTLPSGFSGVVRYRLPLGASAILAFTFLSMREYQSVTASHRPSSSGVAVTASPSRALPVADQSVLATHVSETSSAPARVDTVKPAVVNSAPDVAAVAETSVGRSEPAVTVAYIDGAEELAQTVPWLVAAEQPESVDLSPTARSIANNLAAAKEAHPELTSRFYGSTSNFEKRALPANHQEVDPLAQMRSPADIHRERLLASAVPVTATMAGQTSERIARRISDERLTEEAISRFGARGDRVLVKF